jgi:hypothetical protein
MDFEQTTLWKGAFCEPRTDATREEQTRLAGSYKHMRQRASALVARIAADLPHMAIHDVTHFDALWEMASLACGSQVELNPAEALVFGGAVLFHDAAMTMAAYPGGLAELKDTPEWQDLHARHSTTNFEDNSAIASDVEKWTTDDALRLLHAKHAESLPKISWLGPQGQAMFLIEDQQIRNFYGPKIGKIAYSHWWSIEKVEEELAGTLGALAGITDCTADLLKIACLLRVADAMHLDQRRAPAFEFALAKPTGISADHWRFQERMAKPFVRDDTLVYTAQPAFTVDVAEAWWTAFDSLQMVDRELRNVDRVLRDRQNKPLIVRRVDGAQSPSDLARTVETDGWTPVDSTVRVSDVPKIVATLGGAKLYGKSADAPIRELIQNGLDAIVARRRLQSRPNKWGELQVILEKRPDGYWFCVEDNGVGMSTVVLTGPLIDFGNSFWKSALAIQEFPGLASAGMKARGRYGIGFFSVFMLGDHVRVITRRFDRDARSAKVLEFCNGLSSRPNLRDANLKEVPLDGGTRVEVKLRKNPSEPEGLLYLRDFFEVRVRKLEVMVAAIAPASDVAIKIIHDGNIAGEVSPGDWLEIESSALLSRILQQKNRASEKQSSLMLAELRDEDGRIYGRARIEADSLWTSTGVITVDGLAASLIPMIAGILIGVETTASRNAAQPIVPAPVLAAWASEQALAIAAADLTDASKARAAAIVLACGGDISELPIVYWQSRWLSISQFAAQAKDLENFIIYDGEVSHEDDDDVTKRAFESSFEINESVAHTVGSSGGFLHNGAWIASIMQGKGQEPMQIIEKVLHHSWGGVESEEDALVVGEVGGNEITRIVTVYSRSINEDPSNEQA